MKNERISHAAKYLGKRLRLIADKFRRLGTSSRTSDFGGGSKPSTLVLRERTWHIEVSRSKAKRFLRKNKIAVAGTLAVILAVIVTRYALIGFASTADFYPSSCLGNWDNVQNALGKPDVPSGSGAAAFTTLNSASFNTSTAQMFCGNFSGDTDVSQLEDKSFEGADLILSWSFVFPQPQGSVSGGGGGGGGGTIVEEASSTDQASTTTDLSTSTTIGTSSASSTDDMAAIASSTATEAASSTDASSTNASSTDIVGSNASSSNASSTDMSADNASSTNASSTDEASIESTSTIPEATSTVSSTPPDATPPAPSSTPDGTPPPAPPSPPPADQSSSDTPPTAWFQKLINVVYADDASSVASSAISTSTSTTPLTIASSAQEGTPAAPPPGAINVNTSMFQNIILPSSTADAILAVVYSTDGVTWQPLENIDSSNWQQERYPIPIHSWSELEHLQVAFVGLGAANAPQVFLDAAGVEVSYVDTPEGTTTIIPDTAPSPDDMASTTEPSMIPPEDIIQKPTVSETDVFQQGANQQCVVAPFSQTVAPGGSTNFSVELFSGLTQPSSTTSTGALYQHASYQLQAGSMPAGISASLANSGIASDVSSTKTLRLSASAAASQGSYSLLLIYRERQDDASMRSTGCQFNLVIQ